VLSLRFRDVLEVCVVPIGNPRNWRRRDSARKVWRRRSPCNLQVIKILELKWRTVARPVPIGGVVIEHPEWKAHP
jgi:hypothetical protein